MVSNANDDLPDPDKPVITIRLSLGKSRSMFLRLWVRAPRMRMVSRGMETTIQIRGKGQYIGFESSNFKRRRAAMMAALSPEPEHACLIQVPSTSQSSALVHPA